MKLNFNIGKIQTNEFQLENISIGVQFSSNELKENFNTVKNGIKELPNIIDDLKTTVIAIKNAETEIESKECAINE